MSRKKINIGLFGFGCVGQGLYEVLEKTPTLQASIKTICVKDPLKRRILETKNLVFDKNKILNDSSINVVVELIDDAEAAFEIVSTALKKGKAVVSANKKMIAEHFEELIYLQKQNNVPFLYEAACCASIPIIRNLEEYYDTDLLESIEGIVNGSTNYILSKINSDGLSYSEALKQAQKLGYAESNPILDTEGFDAKYKLIILLTHAFGLIVKPEDIYNFGITHLNQTTFNYAEEKGLKIKLVAQIIKTQNNRIKALVLPKFVQRDDKLFSVNDVFNGIKIKSVFSDSQFFVGKGAGSHPTASAVISDISALSYDYKYAYKKLLEKNVLEKDHDIYLKVFLSIENDTKNINHYFLRIEETYKNQINTYIIGIISLDRLKKILEDKTLIKGCVLFDILNGFDSIKAKKYMEVEWI